MAAKLIALVFPLGLDTFAVSAALGARGESGRHRLKLSLLFAFGFYTLLGPEEDEERLSQLIRLRGASAVLLGISVSLDELAIGFALGLLGLPAALVVALIAMQAFVVTQLGLRLGHRLSERLRDGAERLAGVALIALAVVLLAEKLIG